MHVESVVDTVDEDIVDVEVEAAIGLRDHGIEEFEFGHLAVGQGIGGYVLHADAALEHVLYPSDPVDHVVHRLFTERDRHQVVQLAAIATVRQMLRVGPCVMAVQKDLEIAQKVFVQRGRAADGK
jgi:hypothetical protein